MNPVTFSELRNLFLNDSNYESPKPINPRVTQLGLAALSLTTRGLDTVLGGIYGFTSICTGGLIKQINTAAKVYLNSTDRLLPELFDHLLKSINPNAQVSLQNNIGEGIFNNLLNKASSLGESKNIFQRHFTSRLTFAVAAVAGLVSKAVNAVIAVVTTPMSLVTGGTTPKLNSIAYSALRSISSTPSQLYRVALGLINPTDFSFDLISAFTVKA